ncbi:methyl-accepting chemotaxis protein [Vagococcus sp. WN89Y]|uniref:methyl-accepting chemotaxis protein n=1 Tax=Vagococcus sp. WN89Y TaxID=3457258 RepID=UPI003FCDF330
MFKELKISTGMNILLGILIAGIVVLSAYGITSSRLTKENFEDTILTNDNSSRLDKAVLDMVDGMAQVNASMLATLLNKPVAASDISRAKTLFADSKAKMDLFMSTPFKTEKEKIIAQVIQKRLNSILVTSQEKINYINNPASYPNDIREDAKQRSALIEKVAEYQAQSDALLDSFNLASQQNSWHMMLLSVIFLLVAVICGLGAQLWLKAAMFNRLKQANAAFKTIASGDLSQEIEPGAQNEIGSVLTEAEKMRLSLTNTVYGIRNGAKKIHTDAAEIASDNNDLAARTEQQASALQQTAASMEELKITVRQNADNAHSAKQLAESASVSAQKGGEVMSNLGKIMSEIIVNSRQIADINSVIDGIANQTNILALNAAVEAARAGEQGRGFAVVAGEVRNLAKRSADAAKEIRQLINTCVANMNTGSQEVELAGTSMQEIVGSVIQVTNIMAEITAASDEQSIGINQIAQAVNEMDMVVQQNARMVENAANTATHVEEHASNLNQMVSQFVVNARHISAGEREIYAPQPVIASAKRDYVAAPKHEEEWSSF